MVQVRVFNREGQLVGPVDSPKLVLSDSEWQSRLTGEQYEILRGKGQLFDTGDKKYLEYKDTLRAKILGLDEETIVTYLKQHYTEAKKAVTDSPSTATDQQKKDAADADLVTGALGQAKEGTFVDEKRKTLVHAAERLADEQHDRRLRLDPEDLASEFLRVRAKDVGVQREGNDRYGDAAQKAAALCFAG